jgi:hypothetical protein
MRRGIATSAVAWLLIAGIAWSDDGTPAAPRTPARSDPAGPNPAQPAQEKPADAKALAEMQKALERNAQEIKDLKARYAEEQERLKKQAELQQKQIEVLERTARLLADQLKKQGTSSEAVEGLKTQTATLEARSEQAAKRDVELAERTDMLTEQLDIQKRYGPDLPSPLKQYFLPTWTNTTPLSIWNNFTTIYNLPTHNRGAGTIEFQEYTPFFLIQLNKRFFLSAETTFTQGGVALGQAQMDVFINKWLTADIGYFLAPIGFWSERLDPHWINKLPDVPLVMQQVIPDGLTLTGLQFRGATYVAGSPWKVEYSLFATNGLGVPGAGKAADWYDLSGVIGTTANANSAMAYGGRLGVWYPRRGINFGVSEFVNAPYTAADGAVMSIWQPYFNYHRGNWDARFEYGQNFEKTKTFIGNDINRTGLYAQLAYRDYQCRHKHLQRLEYVFRYSETKFHGIDPKLLDLTAFSPPIGAPVDRNQYTIGVNYYFYPTTILKFAYEINSETHGTLKDNIFMMQFATNF